MSNALGEAISATTTRPVPVDVVNGQVKAMLAVGICVLVAWGFVRILRPEKFWLRRVPGRPNRLCVLHVLSLYAIYLLVTYLTQFVAAAVTGTKIEPSPSIIVSVPAQVLGQFAMIGMCLVLAGRTFRHGLARGLGLSARHWLNDIGRGAVGFLAAVPLCFGALLLTGYMVERGILPQPIEHPSLTLLREAGPAWQVVLIVSVVVFAPIAEELFFRGIVQSFLRRYVGGPWPAVLIVSALFAGVHYPLINTMPALFLLSVVLGYNYERTGRLTGPILIHALFNAANIWLFMSSS